MNAPRSALLMHIQSPSESIAPTAGRQILVAEDDVMTSRLIDSYLRAELFEPIVVGDGKSAVEMFQRYNPCLVILDVMLPIENGLSVCTTIRKQSNVPILFLTARDEEADLEHGFEIGADDYVSKPFSPRELVARVKALLRRAPTAQSVRCSESTTVGLQFDVEKRRFRLNGVTLSLTPIEFTLLKTLYLSPGKVYLRNELLDRLYPDGELVVDRVVDVHIGKIRQKLGDDPARAKYIHTVRGLGYRFTDVE